MYIPIVCPQSTHRQSSTSSLPSCASSYVPYATKTAPSYPYMSTIECMRNGAKANGLHTTATALLLILSLCVTVLSSAVFTIAFLTLK